MPAETANTNHLVEVTVNGEPRSVSVSARTTLADLLRDDLRLTGTHLGCEHGVCGACTVIMDGEPVRSCLVLAVQARGSEVTSVEGLGGPENMGPVQQGCMQAMSFQCGFCTPGFLMSITAYIDERKKGPDGAVPPTQDEVREALSGNLCRCTGYQSIIDGVLKAWELS
ncbi:MAG: (2Fe-2S)-binding protein [Acidimicrobiia bacterium]